VQALEALSVLMCEVRFVLLHEPPAPPRREHRRRDIDAPRVPPRPAYIAVPAVLGRGPAWMEPRLHPGRGPAADRADEGRVDAWTHHTAGPAEAAAARGMLGPQGAAPTGGPAASESPHAPDAGPGHRRVANSWDDRHGDAFYSEEGTPATSPLLLAESATELADPTPTHPGLWGPPDSGPEVIDCELEPGPAETEQDARTDADRFRRMVLGLSDEMCELALRSLAAHRHAGLRGPARVALTGDLGQLSQDERAWVVWMRGAPSPAEPLP